VGRIARKPVEYKDEIALRYCMVLSLTFDHCLVDGAPAARFLRRLKEFIEDPNFLSLS
jgi:pyruvate dehydrogenase E2 component (dihydrolipoamide acetyltransferase)